MVTLHSIFLNTFSTSQLVWSTCFKQTSVTPLEITKAVLERRNSKSYPDLSETPSQIYMFRQHRCQRDPSRPPSVTAGKARQGCRSLEGCHAALAKTMRGEASEVGGWGSQFTMHALLLLQHHHRLTGHGSLKVHDVLAFAGLLHRSQGCLRSICQHDLERHKGRKSWGGGGGRGGGGWGDESLSAWVKKTVPVSGEFAAPQEEDVWFSDHVIKVPFAIKYFFVFL